MDILIWNKMKEKLTIIKVGGAVVEDEVQLERLLHDFSTVEGKKILVHGGGRRATSIASRLGIESKMINGRRITDSDMLEIVTMVYGGLVNKNIVARLQAIGTNALGLTGADMNSILAHKRIVKDVDYGFVGDVDEVNADQLSTLLDNGITPVIAPLTHDGKGHILNTNADTMAAETAKSMTGKYNVTLIYAFEKPGVMKDPDDDSTLIPVITRSDFEKYQQDGTISGGMIPKIENALNTVDAGVEKVIITMATAIDGLHGTTIK